MVTYKRTRKYYFACKDKKVRFKSVIFDYLPPMYFNTTIGMIMLSI
ncbi:hypothetical protein C8E03_109104 [Lachnotalea glycerini]|uniref:Uncharacterized protein n=1 Tax=Lachnotalea glycerini TaxID=1763509 RepID=A0A318EJG8_9FIRM|nr:hypothetical protein C8E03_109104 [Lachnotalea glycerini]